MAYLLGSQGQEQGVLRVVALAFSMSSQPPTASAVKYKSPALETPPPLGNFGTTIEKLPEHCPKCRNQRVLELLFLRAHA